MGGIINLTNKTILISRTDSIGDVVLTLPLCVWIKANYPNCKIIFLGNTYTKPVISCLQEIDEILCWKDFENLTIGARVEKIESLKIDICLHVFPRKEIATLVKKAKIKIRIGTSHRLFHLFTCNYRPNFSRKNSDLHESQLNFELLKPFGLKQIPILDEITCNFSLSFNIPKIRVYKSFFRIKDPIILHPKSQGSALEWPLEKYKLLAERLLEKGEHVVFTGTEIEGASFKDFVPSHANCFDLSGQMTLEELIVFIARSKTLVACSTGPLHLAGVLAIKTIGLFSSRRPIHPGRWKALGIDVHVVENDINCARCLSGKTCPCIREIEVDRILELV